MLDGIPHCPKLDLGEGILIRLDMCYNHQVGDAVEDYIKAIGNLDYPHRRTKHHRYEGVEFRAKHKTTKFYNKEREIRIYRSLWNSAPGNNPNGRQGYSKVSKKETPDLA